MGFVSRNPGTVAPVAFHKSASGQIVEPRSGAIPKQNYAYPNSHPFRGSRFSKALALSLLVNLPCRKS